MTITQTSKLLKISNIEIVCGREALHRHCLNILNTIHAHTILVMSPNFATEEACKCFDSYTFKKFFLLCFSIYNLIGSAGRQEQKITLLSTLKAVQLNRTMASIYYFC